MTNLPPSKIVKGSVRFIHGMSDPRPRNGGLHDVVDRSLGIAPVSGCHEQPVVKLVIPDE